MAANRNYRQVVIRNAPTRQISFTALLKIPTYGSGSVHSVSVQQGLFTLLQQTIKRTLTQYALSYVNIHQHVSADSATIISVSYKNKDINCNSKWLYLCNLGNCYRFNNQQLYALSTLYLYALYLFENKQRLVPHTLIGFL